MGKGYMGKILFVDLGKGTFQEEVVPDEVYEKYLSGQGLGAYILYDRIPKDADPLGPDNILGFVSGLLTGTGSLFTGRWMVVGKSPITGGWGDANCGGTLSPAIKRCGYDGIFIKGVSKKPVYLFVDNGKPEIRDASHLWGKDTVETEELLIKEIGKKNTRVACIGPAGERLSLIAGIANDKGRIAARSGLGAVMGSKKLKAIVLSGAKRITPRNRDEIKRLSSKLNKIVQLKLPFPSGPMTAYVGTLIGKMPTQMVQDGLLYKSLLQKWGTGSMNQMSIEMGDSPIKNWKGSNEDFGLSISKATNPDVFKEREMVKYHCYSCPLGCGGICTMPSKYDSYEETHKPEYETVLVFGGLVMNKDADSIFYLNELMNRAGMDSISAGGSIAFAIECFENGILTKDDTDGLELTWGNTEAIIALAKKIIAREGIGDLLADGPKVAAEKIGKDSINYAIQAGGQALPMHDGRNDPGFALHYSVEPTPGRHTIGAQLYYEMYQLWKKVKSLPKPKFIYHKDTKYVADKQKAIMAAACSKYNQLYNGAGLCLFGAFIGASRLPIFEWLNAATGWSKSPEEYMEIGERIQTLRQAFNIKHGVDPKNFKASERALGRPPLEKGVNKGRSVDIEKMMADYWETFGWDAESGKPTKETMDRLGLNQ